MKKQLILIVILSLWIPVFAQFNGGSGDGMDKSTVIQTNLNGIIGGIIPLYQGGGGDGSTQNIISSWLNEANQSVLYTGGGGDGFVSSKASLFLNGISLASLYTGGSGDGFDHKKFSGFLNNTGAIVLYNGGIGDGFDKKSFNGFLDGSSSEMFYSGGSGDGVEYAQIQSYLNGVSLDALYGGGEGDGFAKADFSGAIVLPLELLSFDATAKEMYVLVKWVTASEQNNEFFTIERSQNGALFNNLAVVPSQGNSQTVQAYAINDHDPLQGRSYYRLKWTNVDGQSAYSDIQSILFDHNNNSKDFLLFPNPNEGNILYVQLDGITSNEKISFSVTDMQGKILYESQNPAIAGNRINITLPKQLSKGSYVVQVIRNGVPSTKILIVK